MYKDKRETQGRELKWKMLGFLNCKDDQYLQKT